MFTICKQFLSATVCTTFLTFGRAVVKEGTSENADVTLWFDREIIVNARKRRRPGLLASECREWQTQRGTPQEYRYFTEEGLYEFVREIEIINHRLHGLHGFS